MDGSIGKKVFHGTLVIVLVGILAKFTAFITEALLAAYLGTSYRSDAYYMVSSVQSVVYPMLSIGIWKVFLPAYKEQTALDNTEKAFALTNKALSFFTIISTVTVALIILFTSPLVSVIAPGFTGETKALCIQLVRISAPMYLFIIASAVYASVLQCHGRFFGSQIREIASHIPTIVAAVFFYGRFGIKAMAYALVAGGAVRLLIELPFVNWGYHFKPDFKFRTKEFSTMLKRLPSALISAGVAQLNALIDKAMASTLPEGTISALNYGHRLVNVFSGLLSSAISTALYPQMIELIALKKEDVLSRLVVKIINIFCVLMVPVTVACVLFRAELVSAVFQRGAFNQASTAMTAGVFALYSLGIFFTASSSVVSNLFYGYGDTRTPMWISIAAVIINVTLNLILIHLWGINGLTLATSVSSIIVFFIRMKAAEKRVKLNNALMLTTALKVLTAALVACFVPRLLFWFYSVNKYLVLIASAVIGVGIYLPLVKLLKITEMDDILALVKKKVNNR